MKYTRQPIYMQILDDILPEGTMMYRRPNLPEITFKRNKIKYTVTDLRPLNKDAIYVFENILTRVIDGRATDFVDFVLPDGTDEDDLNCIIDIVTGIKIEATKGGKNSFMVDTCFLVTDVHIIVDGDGKRVRFNLIKEHVQTIREYAKDHEDMNIDLFDLAVAIVDDSRKRFAEEVTDGTED